MNKFPCTALIHSCCGHKRGEMGYFSLSLLHFCRTLLEHAGCVCCVSPVRSALARVQDVTRLPLQNSRQVAQLLGTKQVSIFRDNCNYLGCRLGLKNVCSRFSSAETRPGYLTCVSSFISLRNTSARRSRPHQSCRVDGTHCLFFATFIWPRCACLDRKGFFGAAFSNTVRPKRPDCFTFFSRNSGWYVNGMSQHI